MMATQFHVFDLSFIFFTAMSQTNNCYKQKWGVLFFTHIKLKARVLTCACPIAHIKWKGLLYATTTLILIPLKFHLMQSLPVFKII